MKREEACCHPTQSVLLVTMALLVGASPLVSPAQGQTHESSDWQIEGDFRLRYERTSQTEPGAEPLVLEPRNRGVVRLRAGVTKKFDDLLKFGARLTTGPRDDPNSSDITLGDFDDSFEVSLDRAYLELTYKSIFLSGGKFANPFLTTELVWDGDVNPQGVAAAYSFSRPGHWTTKFTGLYFIVDEQAIEPDSSMVGFQTEFLIHPSPNWSLRLSGGYYDYNIESLRSADAGDIRSNRLTPDGIGYVSDFNLIDAIAMVDYRGLGEHYPIQFVADFVHNRGAQDENNGLMLDLFIGRALQKNDRQFRYGYARAGTDAVLAAFSNDNTTLPTNYEQHTVTFDYVALRSLLLNATWYYYRLLKPETDSNPWVSRLRLNATVSF